MITQAQIEAAAKAFQRLMDNAKDGPTDVDIVETILTAAAQVGEPQPADPAGVSERAMKVATVATIERCAQVADKIAASHSWGSMAEEVWGQGTAREIAAAIRKLKDEP